MSSGLLFLSPAPPVDLIRSLRDNVLMSDDLAGELLFTADWILPVTSPPVRHGAVLVRGGRVDAVGLRADLEPCLPPGSRVIACPGAAILPGLVNAHTHLELTALRGLFEDLDFFTWIRRLTLVKERLLESDFLASARWGAVEALKGGITTVGDCSSSGQVAQALGEVGLTGRVYQEVFGPDPRQCPAAIAGLEEALDRQSSRARGRVVLGVSPHAPYTVSGELFRAVAALASRRNLSVALHAAESRAESLLLARGTGPMADRLRERGIPWKAPGASPIRYLERTGILEVRPLVVHAIELDAADVELLVARGAPVAHCPRSNAKLGHAVAPLLELLRAKVHVGLGTDGPVASNHCDLFEEARLAVLLQRTRQEKSLEERGALVARDILRMLTLGGAEALGLEREIGSIEVGKRADLTAVSLRRGCQAPEHDPETTVVFATCAADVSWTAVDGRILQEHGHLSHVDEDRWRADLELAAARARGASGR